MGEQGLGSRRWCRFVIDFIGHSFHEEYAIFEPGVKVSVVVHFEHGIWHRVKGEQGLEGVKDF